MKPIKLIFLFLLSAGAFIISSSFTAEKSTQMAVLGTYKTYDDYVQNHLVMYDAIEVGKHTYKGTLKGTKISATKYKDADFWGIKDENGVVYRVNKKTNSPERIITKGKICFYAGIEYVIVVDEMGNLKSEQVKGDDADSKFSDIFLVSDGGSGEMIAASEDNLSKLFADSPALIAKMHKTGIDEKDTKKWLDDMKNVSGWIGEYNKAHQ